MIIDHYTFDGILELQAVSGLNHWALMLGLVQK